MTVNPARNPMCLGASANVTAECGQPGPHGMHPLGQLLPPPAPVDRAALLRCPDWCIADHSGELLDAVNNLVTHEAAPQAYGIRVCRTDCPDEGTVGVPVLRVAVELELTSWQDAGRLAHAVLDGVDYLTGAGASGDDLDVPMVPGFCVIDRTNWCQTHQGVHSVPDAL